MGRFIAKDPATAGRSLATLGMTWVVTDNLTCLIDSTYINFAVIAVESKIEIACEFLVDSSLE